jgi:ubiquinol-cytochrome c reductase core subunit 2
MQLHQKALLANTTRMAQNSAFALAFHRGLGESLNMASSVPINKYVDADSVAEFAASVYAKPSFAIVGNGVAHNELNKWVNEFFTDIPSQAAGKLESQQSKYFGGEERISHGSGNSMVIAFPGSSSPTGSSYKPEASVLAAILGGPSSIKWSAGSSKLLQATQNARNLKIETKSDIFSDAGLFSITLSGSADDIASNAKSVVETLKSIASGVSKEDLAKGKALAKFKELEYGQSTQAALELTGAGLIQGGKPYQIDEVGKAMDTVTAEKVQQLAKEALENRATVSAVGDLYVLPYADEIGLRV